MWAYHNVCGHFIMCVCCNVRGRIIMCVCVCGDVCGDACGHIIMCVGVS